jgi:hypothetical protein
MSFVDHSLSEIMRNPRIHDTLEMCDEYRFLYSILISWIASLTWHWNHVWKWTNVILDTHSLLMKIFSWNDSFGDFVRSRVKLPTWRIIMHNNAKNAGRTLDLEVKRTRCCWRNLFTWDDRGCRSKTDFSGRTNANLENRYAMLIWQAWILHKTFHLWTIPGDRAGLLCP